MGRATQGVTLIALDPNTTLSGLQRIVETDAEAREADAAARRRRGRRIRRRAATPARGRDGA